MISNLSNSSTTWSTTVQSQVEMNLNGSFGQEWCIIKITFRWVHSKIILFYTYRSQQNRVLLQYEHVFLSICKMTVGIDTSYFYAQLIDATSHIRVMLRQRTQPQLVPQQSYTSQLANQQLNLRDSLWYLLANGNQVTLENGKLDREP